MIAEPEQFDRPFVLLCEGKGDENFFKRFFEERKLGDDFHIRIPFKANAYNGGRSNFGADLSIISVNESFIEKVKAILIVSDNDDDMDKSFREVLDEIKKVKGLGIPKAEREVARSSKGQPDVVVLTMPPGATGNLEVLCLEAAYSKWPLRGQLDTFVRNTAPNDWPKGKQAKMRMQTILAATNNKQPDTGFAAHWRQDKQYQVPLNHACFDDLATFLGGFSTLVA